MIVSLEIATTLSTMFLGWNVFASNIPILARSSNSSRISALIAPSWDLAALTLATIRAFPINLVACPRDPNSPANQGAPAQCEGDWLDGCSSDLQVCPRCLCTCSFGQCVQKACSRESWKFHRRTRGGTAHHSVTFCIFSLAYLGVWVRGYSYGWKKEISYWDRMRVRSIMSLSLSTGSKMPLIDSAVHDKLTSCRQLERTQNPSRLWSHDRVKHSAFEIWQEVSPSFPKFLKLRHLSFNEPPPRLVIPKHNSGQFTSIVHFPCPIKFTLLSSNLFFSWMQNTFLS